MSDVPPSKLDPAEEALLDTVRVALSSSPSALRQLVRRFVKSPPASSNPVEVKAQLTALLAVAPPDPAGALRRAKVDAQPPQPVSMPSAVDMAMPGLDIANPSGVDVPVLSEAITSALEAVISERRNEDLLRAHGLSATSKLLLTGPPGVGKTLTAHYLASSLQLPLLTVDLSALMSSYLGRTAKNLQAVLERARGIECVLFFDEFDALAKSRGDSQDVGEVKRVVNVLLLELEKASSTLLIAATNHPDLLDPAIYRRFDREVALGYPTIAQRAELVSRNRAIQEGGLSMRDCEVVAIATDGWSHSDIDRKIAEIAKSVVVRGHGWEGMRPAVLGWSLDSLSKSADTDARRAAAHAAVNGLGMSRRQTAEVLGVTHPTVSKLLADLTSTGLAHE